MYKCYMRETMYSIVGYCGNAQCLAFERGGRGRWTGGREWEKDERAG